MDNWKDQIDSLSREQLLEEAARIEAELGLPPITKEEPDEALIAYERMKEENRKKAAEKQEKEEKKILLLEKKKRKNSRILRPGSGVAAACIGILCVFAASMTSQGNRQWVMKRLDYIRGNGQVVYQTQDGSWSDNDTLTEMRVTEEIESALGVQVPGLFYHPDEFKLVEYEVHEERGTATIRFQCNNKNLFLRISNEANKDSDFFLADGGIFRTLDDSIKQMSGIEISLCYTQREDTEIIYMAEWDYKGGHYQLTGGIEKSLFVKILENMDYSQ